MKERDTARTPLRVYTDSSVIGGCFDEEFAEHSVRLIERARVNERHGYRPLTIISPAEVTYEDED